MEEKREQDAWIFEMAKKEMWSTPKSCQDQVEHILKELPERVEKEEYQMRHFWKKRTLLFVAALAAVLGMTAAASEIFKWREAAIDHFGNPTEEEQQVMTMEGIAKEQEVSATDAGITITAQQTVQDKNTLYILLKIEAEEAILDGNGGFDNPDADGNYGEPWIVTKEAEAFSNVSMGFTPDTPSFGELSTEGYYEIQAMKSMEQTWNEDQVTVHFTEYSYYTYENGESIPHKIQGDWTLLLPLGEDTKLTMKEYEPSKEVEIADVPVQVKRVELSPLSLLLIFDMDDLLTLQEKLYADETDVYLYETAFAGFLDQNGQEVLTGVGGQSGKYDYDKREIVYQIGLGSYINPDQIRAVLLGDEKIPIFLN